MRAKARTRYQFGLYTVLFFAVTLAVLCITGVRVEAGVNRPAKNGVEADRSWLCATRGPSDPTVYGAVWINGVPTSDVTDTRWQESISVSASATDVDATMWTTAYSCAGVGPNVTNARIINLASASGGQISVAFPYGNSIYRGDFNQGQFSDPPGSLRVRLNIGNRGSGCYTTAYSGQYVDNAGAGLSTTYFTNVCITRQTPSPVGSLDSASCSAINGWAYHPSNPSDNPWLDVYLHNYDGTLYKKVGRFRAWKGTGNPPAAQQSDGFYLYKVIDRPDVRSAMSINTSEVGYQIPKSALEPYWDAYKYRVVVKAIGYDGSEVKLNPSHEGNQILQPCAPPECTTAIALNPTNPEIGQPFTATTGFTYGPGAQGRTLAPYSFVTNLSGVGGGAMQEGANQSTRTGASFTYNVPPITNPGRYSINWRVAWYPDGSTGIISGALSEGDNGGCRDGNNVEIVNKPYLRVFGNDTAAGAYFKREDGICSVSDMPNPKAGILAFTQNSSSTTWKGAGDDLAAYALGGIAEFISASNRNAPGREAHPPKGLTVGGYLTTSDNPTDTFGGLGGQSRCVPNYFKEVGGALKSTGATAITDPEFSAASTGSAVYEPVGGKLVIGSDLTVNAGQKRAIVVDGDVQLNGNTNYGAYSSIANMPSLYIVAKGDIYISGAVEQLSGVFIAQPRANGTGGKIYTCTNTSGARYAAADVYSECNKKLTINGAFIANQVKFLRTSGTVSAGGVDESWDGPIAEVFKSSGQLYLSAPDALRKPSSTNNRTYDSVTSLPPIL